MRTTFVSHGNYVVASVIPVILCAPKFLAGTMTLGQVMQATAAFIQVQYAFNWIVDNYPRLAEFTASARRVASLIVSLDKLDAVGRHVDQARRRREGAAIRLKDVSVELTDGTVVIDDADVVVQLGEKVLLAGDSGSGKSTLVRAIAGLWPWGEGEISLKPGAKLFMMPQRPYVPLGTLRRAAAYPQAADSVDDAALKEALKTVGLDHRGGSPRRGGRVLGSGALRRREAAAGVRTPAAATSPTSSSWTRRPRRSTPKARPG